MINRGPTDEKQYWIDPMENPGVFVTKAALARQQIQRMILSGAVRPGDRITTREVSSALGFSETPIREAIQGLAAEGWLEVQNHVGAVVQGLKVEQVKEISALRGLVCALAIQLGAPDYDEAIMVKLDENIEASAVALADQDYALFAQLNHEFHRLLCDGPNTPYCHRILENMLGLMSSQRHGVPASPKRLKQALGEHRRIRDLLRAQDFEGAAELAKQHELTTGSVLIRMLSQAEAAAPRSRR